MKRKSDLSRRYMLYRMIPFLEPNEEYLSVDTRMTLRTLTLVKPKVRFIMDGLGLEIIQKIPKEQTKNEFWIKGSLKKEAYQIFEGFPIEEVIIKIDYNE